ncbi:phosphotransferase [Candidatus Solirubrobacter pratensis]|uniref:phosphotransferase n=1 Tax=Candidatus Solirubrobacter pratensis TaxID=1298857 RepID=UPI00042874F9|nr:phosphotransferase [Candidatus Solirubrobacter pratensis]
MEEERLAGGNLGGAVRAGDTVRKAAKPRTAWVQGLLAWVRERGFPEAPEPLGLDERGREALGFIEGDVPEYPLPPWALTDDALVAVARLLRRLHDASAGYDGAGVVCHNDVAPYNTVYVDGRPVAFIDWDFAAPAPGAWDLAHVAWRFAPLTAGGDVAESARRVRLVCDAYGLQERAGFVETIAARAQWLHDTIRDRAAAGDPGFAAMWSTEHSKQPLRDRAWVLAHAAQLAP